MTLSISLGISKGEGRGRVFCWPNDPSWGTICNQDWVGFLPSFSSCIPAQPTTGLEMTDNCEIITPDSLVMVRSGAVDI